MSDDAFPFIEGKKQKFGNILERCQIIAHAFITMPLALRERLNYFLQCTKVGYLEITAEARHAFTWHHFFNTLLCISFYVIKMFDPLCELIFPRNVTCGVSLYEHQVLAFVAFVIYWKNRKASGWLHYLSTAFTFFRMANVVLFFQVDPVCGVIYVFAQLVVAVLFPEPAYTGPERVTYFTGPELKEELNKKRTTWVIEFYASWSPQCQRIAPLFSKLSQQFSLPNLKFGKLDVGRWQADADHFRINTAATSRQLPTIAVFRTGQEAVRRPVVQRGRALSYIFNQENVTRDLDLINLYNECMKNLSKNERKQLRGDGKPEENAENVDVVDNDHIKSE